jgi:hypothetical protein
MIMTAVPTAGEALELLEGQLDLTNVRLKLSDREEGKGYDDRHLDLMETEYRRFLALQRTYPEADIVPCKLVDEMCRTARLLTDGHRSVFRTGPWRAHVGWPAL